MMAAVAVAVAVAVAAVVDASAAVVASNVILGAAPPFGRMLASHVDLGP